MLGLDFSRASAAPTAVSHPFNDTRHARFPSVSPRLPRTGWRPQPFTCWSHALAVLRSPRMPACSL